MAATNKKLNLLCYFVGVRRGGGGERERKVMFATTNLRDFQTLNSDIAIQICPVPTPTPCRWDGFSPYCHLLSPTAVERCGLKLRAPPVFEHQELSSLLLGRHRLIFPASLLSFTINILFTVVISAKVTNRICFYPKLGVLAVL